MMKRCVIFTGGELKDISAIPHEIYDNAFVIAADSGYKYAMELGVIPDVTMGDYDSLGYVPKQSGEVMTFPKEKDDSDLMLTIREALKRGYKDITILGALGGRFDHTISNLQTLSFILDNGGRGRIVSESEDIFLLAPGSCKVKRNEQRSLSLFAYSEKVKGLTIKGAKYPLENGTITSSFPIGLSNEIIDDEAEISFTDGKLLVILSAL